MNRKTSSWGRKWDGQWPTDGLRNAFPVVTVIVVGLVLAALILRLDASSDNRAEGRLYEAHVGHGQKPDAERSHGEIRRLSQDGFDIELALCEMEGAPPFSGHRL